MAHRVTRRIQFQEIDAAGVVYFARFHDIAHQVWEQVLLDVGYDLATPLAARTFGYPLVHCEADFRHPLRHGDSAAIDVTCVKVGTTSFTIRFAFSLAATATDVATLTHVHACVDLKAMKAAPVPCGLLAALERLREG